MLDLVLGVELVVGGVVRYLEICGCGYLIVQHEAFQVLGIGCVEICSWGCRGAGIREGFTIFFGVSLMSFCVLFRYKEFLTFSSFCV